MRGPNRIVVNDGNIPHNRYEIHPPDVKYMNPKPEYEFRSMAIIPSLTMPPVDESSMYYNMTFDQIVFTYTEIIYTKWIEDNIENGTSFGYFIEFVSYVHLPDGMDLQGLLGSSRDIMYGGNDIEQQYQRRMIDIEGQLAALRSDRLILPQEEIDKIHQGRKELNDKPIKSEWFDDNIFEVE